MADRLSPVQRSRNMARIRGADTRPERALRSALHRLGFRYRLHQSDLPGRPDLVLRRYSAVIFVHGCFWHRHPGCPFATVPKTRPEFWERKLNTNVIRDRKQIDALRRQHWRVMVVWECALRRGALDSTMRSVGRWLKGNSGFREAASRAGMKARLPRAKKHEDHANKNAFASLPSCTPT